MSEWKEYRLEDFASFKYGKLPPKGVVANGYPIWSGYKYVGTAETYNCPKNTPIVVARGVGGTGDVKIAKEDCFLTNLSILVSLNVRICNPHFFTYYFAKDNLRYLDSGSAQSQITIEALKSVVLKLPPLSEQKRIAAILSSLDEKIETNRKINEQLEELAQALFKSWFIDFEPFGGKMPEDWKPCTLGAFTSECKDRVKNRKDVRVFSPLSSGELALSDEYFTKQVYSKDISKYIVVKPKTFAYNPARINIGSIGINEYGFDGCVSPVYVVFKALDGYEEFINQFIKTKLFKEEVLLRAIGGVRQTLSYNDFSLIEFIKPSIEAVTQYTNMVAPLYTKMKALDIESSHLAALRDTLLPKLMSGELIQE